MASREFIRRGLASMSRFRGHIDTEREEFGENRSREQIMVTKTEAAGIAPPRSAKKLTWAAGSVLTVCLGLGLVWFCSAHRLDHRRDAAGDKLDTGAAADTKPHVGVQKTPVRPVFSEEQYQTVTGDVSLKLHKMAAVAGLSDGQIDAAGRAAALTVNEALRKPGVLPPASTIALSQSCDLVIQGLPQIGSRQQRCCKASNIQMGPGGMAQGSGPSRPAGGVQGEGGEAGGGGEGGQLPMGGRAQRAQGSGGIEAVCFPSFIIAGTQKSGTTALTGILEKHPQVRMAGRKELHFFDNKVPTNTKFTEVYANNFARFNASLALEHQAPFLVGEATPFYFASRNACENMIKLLPELRLIVLVRDPVKRAYSEHQMKVRRVEELEEMMKLLQRDANLIYNCAVSAFPSVDGKMTQRESQLMWNTSGMTSKIGECAGEAGEHGKWMDTMLPFIKRIKGKLTGARSLEDSPKAIAALEGLKTDFSRCFPLKTVAQELERLHPGGKWRANWSKALPKGMASKRPTLPKVPMGNGGNDFHGPGMGGAFPRGAGGPHHRNLRYQYEQRWNSPAADPGIPVTTTAALGDGYGVVEDEDFHGWNTTTATGTRTAPGWYPAADEGGASLSDDGVAMSARRGAMSAYDGSEEGFLRELSGEDERYGGGYLEGMGGEGGGEGWAAGGGGVFEGEGWDEWSWWNEGASEEGVVDVARDPRRKGEEFSWGGGGPEGYGTGRADEVFLSEGEEGALDVGGRSLRNAGPSGLSGEGTVGRKAWGAWGQEGAREFDPTCYVRMEKVEPAEKVMKREMSSLRKCFGQALADLGGLEALPDLDARVAAGAMDERINSCFSVTPGISDQYIYRSLFGVQAYHCLKHIPREQLLFIESDDLRDKPDDILPMVHRHIGVSDFKYDNIGQTAIMQELEKKYPDFEKRTGWRLNSAYKTEMSEDLAKEVGNFLKPFTSMFARLVGQDFGDWAVDTAGGKEAMLGAGERSNDLFEEEFRKEVLKITQDNASD